MNILVNLFFLFIYVYLSLIFKFPNIATNNYILHKFYIFLSLFVFQFMLVMCTSTLNGCTINLKDCAINALSVATSGIIGYSIYIDLLCNGTIKQYKLNGFKPAFLYLNITILIILFISFIKVLQMLIMTPNYCN